MLCQWLMRMVPNDPPTAHVLSSLEPEPNERRPSTEEFQSPFVLKDSRLFSGNGGLIFIGIFAGALALPIAAHFFSHHGKVQGHAAEVPVPKTAPVEVSSATALAVYTPAPVVVQINPDILRVTAIALGHPRLALINGKQVAEGDFFTVQGPPASDPVTLEVRKIGDGEIELAAGSQLITARLAVQNGSQAESH